MPAAAGPIQSAIDADGAPSSITLTGLAVGDYIFVAGTVSTAHAHTIAPSDDKGESYTAPDGLISDGTNQQQIRAWWAKVATAGDHVVSMACSNPLAGETYCGIAACVITGAAGTAGVTASGPGQHQLAAGLGTDAVTSGTAQTPGGLPALVVAFSFDDSTAINPPTEGTGFASLGTGWFGGLRVEAKRITSGTAQGTFTNSAPVSTLTQMIAFLEATVLAVASGAFQVAPSQARLRAPRVDNWEPLPGLPRLSLGWGFSGGDSYTPTAPRVDNWEPLPAPQVTAVARGVWDSSPLPSRLHAPPVATWEPLPPLLLDTAFSDQSHPPRPKRARNEGWEPLGLLPISSARPLVDASSPQPCRRAAPRPDGWEPLAGIAAAPAVTSGGWECQAAPQRLVRAQQPQAWEPLAPLLVPSVECSAVAPSRLRAPAVQGWEPLPALIATPLTPAGGFESAAPPVPARRSPVVQAWEPLGAVQAPPSVAPLGFSDSPTSRATRARVEAWEPVPALPPVADVACFSEPPIARRAGARIDGWSPVPSLTADALGPLVCSVVPPQPRRQQQAPGGWEPLASLTDATGDCFSPPPTKSRQRGAMVACWEPLAGITALPAPEAWGFSAQPVGRVRAARVDSWGVLASLSVGPVAPMRQQYLLQAV